MKMRLSIRAQNAIWIVPLFLVLSGVSAWASYKAIKQDLMWSFEEEARSLAIAIAELVDRDELKELISGGEEHDADIAAPIKRLRRWGHLHRLSIYDTEGGLLASYGGLQTVDDELLQLTLEQKVWVLEEEVVHAVDKEDNGRLDLRVEEETVQAVDKDDKPTPEERRTRILELLTPELRARILEEDELRELVQLVDDERVQLTPKLKDWIPDRQLEHVWVQRIAEYLPEGPVARLWHSAKRLERVWVERIAEYLPEGPVARLWHSVKPRIESWRWETDRVDETSPEGALLSALAPVRKRAGGSVVDGLKGCLLDDGRIAGLDDATPMAWVRVETHVDDFVGQVESFRRKVLVQVFSSCLLGLVLVALLTKIVAPKLRQLAHAVEQVSTGHFGHDLEEGSVREINDLANTFGTMVSVLRETVDKGRRSVMDREESRATSEIADTWARQHLVPRTLQVGGFELAAMLGPEAAESSFLGLFGLPGEDGSDSPAGFVGVIGSVGGEDPVALAACSTAVPRFLEEHLGAFTPERLLAEVRDRFGVANARLVAWNQRDDRVLYLTQEAGGGIERRELSREELAETGLLVQEETGSSGDETLTTLTGWVAPVDAQGFLTHLQRLVTGARRGGALFIRAREPGTG